MGENKNEGFPDVANLKQPKNILVLGLMLGIVITVIVLSHFFKKEKKPMAVSEEMYAVQPAINVGIGGQKTDTKSMVKSIMPVAPPPVSPEAMQRQIALVQQEQQELQQRLAAPLMIVNNINNNNIISNNSSNNGPGQPPFIAKDANTQFMKHLSAQTTETVNATTIGPLNTIIMEGNFIHAILEPATVSELPGHLRAIISVPVYSEDGSQILVPPGSRLLGQYQSGVLQGQSRLFVVWTRLITPNGLSVQLGLPGVDNLGMAGMKADEIDRHFWQRFGTASLLSLIGAGAANVGVDNQEQNNSSAMYREAVASSFSQSANQALQQDMKITTVLKKHQGQPIMVFVAKDLHFANAMQAAKPNMNVF